MEYWKTNSQHRFSITLYRCQRDSQMHRVHERKTITPVLQYSITPLLHHSLKLLQAEPNISDPRRRDLRLAQRTGISKFD
jgi:hypothetical protein